MQGVRARDQGEVVRARDFFRKLREKLRLFDQDLTDRYTFAKKYRVKSVAWWLKTLHMVIDLKTFPVYLNGKARDAAARREVRGTYRKRSKARPGLARPSARYPHWRV